MSEENKTPEEAKEAAEEHTEEKETEETAESVPGKEPLPYQIDASALPAGKPEKELGGKPWTAILVMMVISILMIVFNVLRILGWIVLPISILALVLAKNYIQFSFYPEGMAVWKQNDTAHCQYIPYANIVEWTFQQNTNGVNTLILRTTDHQNVTADCLRSSAVSEVLNKRMPEKEALARANARAKAEDAARKKARQELKKKK